MRNDHERNWELVDAVSRSPLFESPQVGKGIDLGHLEEVLLVAHGLPAAERERLLAAVRELAALYRVATQSDADAA